MSLKLHTRISNGVVVVDVSGRLTLGETASGLRDTLREMATIGHRRILLNLGELTTLDSTGIGVLVSSFATFKSVGGQMKLVNLSERVKDLLLLTKLYTVFEVFPDEASAIASFDSTGAATSQG